MATRTLTSRSNLEIELSNILISEAIFVFIFSGCKTYLSVRSFVEGISAPSDHYPHHPKHYENINRQVWARWIFWNFSIIFFKTFMLKQHRFSAPASSIVKKPLTNIFLWKYILGLQTKVGYPTTGFVGIFYIYLSPSRKKERNLVQRMYLESFSQWAVVGGLCRKIFMKSEETRKNRIY